MSGTCDPVAVQTCITQAASAPATGECHVDVTAACTATVGELRACADATTSAVESATSGISCSNFAARFASLQGAEPAACTTAKQKCAELFEGDSNSDANP